MRSFLSIILGFCVATIQLNGQSRRLEISYDVGIVDEELARDYNKTTLLNPEISIGYEIINDWMLSVKVGYWDNKLSSMLDADGIDNIMFNTRDTFYGIAVRKKQNRRLGIQPFAGLTVHQMKSYCISNGIKSCIDHDTHTDILSSVDLGIRLGWLITSKFKYQISIQESKFIEPKDYTNTFWWMYKTGLTYMFQ